MVTWRCVCCQDCWSALISAAKEGHVDVVKELLENSAYVEHRDMVRHAHTHKHTHRRVYRHTLRLNKVRGHLPAVVF